MQMGSPFEAHLKGTVLEQANIRKALSSIQSFPLCSPM
jgi:hypothetical protein